MTMQNQTEKPKNKPASNDAPKPAPVATEGVPVSAESKEEKTRGAIPQMPIAVFWRDPTNPKPIAIAIIHPRGGEYIVRGKGLGGTKGSLEDDGYPLGAIRTEAPKWVLPRIPVGVEVLGFANILGFPLPQS